ncbi:sodium [Arthrobacter sp. Hiyo1]|nr:sodium [Arthrobacter sp. Hiyo1]
MTSQRGEIAPAKAGRKGLDKSHYLYIAVIAAVVLGAVVGLLFPEVVNPSSPWVTASSSSSR